MVTVAYTDGACRGNPGPGGWAWAVPGGAFGAGYENPSTNQRMEIQAAAEAVDAIDGPLEIVSDSTYVVNCFNDGWYKGWHKRGWKNKAKKDVANRDLWEPFIDAVLARGDVTFRWVKGHSGDPMNDLVDALAVEAAENQQDRTGDEPPDSIGPADSVGAAAGVAPTPAMSTKTRAAHDAVEAARDRRLPSARLVTVLGHRPPEMGGYDSPVLDSVRSTLAEILAAKYEMDADLHVVSGLRLGAETLGAEAAIEVGVPLIGVLPYPDPDAKWPKASRQRFAELSEAAVTVLTLERRAPETTQKAGAALRRRDGWLMANVDEAILVWNGESVLRRLHQDLEDRLGDDVWVLDPGH